MNLWSSFNNRWSPMYTTERLPTKYHSFPGIWVHYSIVLTNLAICNTIKRTCSIILTLSFIKWISSSKSRLLCWFQNIHVVIPVLYRLMCPLSCWTCLIRRQWCTHVRLNVFYTSYNIQLLLHHITEHRSYHWWNSFESSLRAGFFLSQVSLKHTAVIA